MKLDLYWLLLLVVSALFSLVCVVAWRAGGARRLWQAALVAVVLIELLSLLWWLSEPYKETPLITDVLLGIVPSVVTAGLVYLLASRRVHTGIMLLVGTISWAVVALATVYWSFFL